MTTSRETALRVHGCRGQVQTDLLEGAPWSSASSDPCLLQAKEWRGQVLGWSDQIV